MKSYLAQRIASFGHAFRGVGMAFGSEVHVRFHTVATVGVLGLSIYVGLERWEWAAIIGVIGLVWVAELMNTAVEALVDLASPEQHPLARKAKDVAAAGVLVAAFAALVVGAIVFLPYV
jgi:diacylglycerol kinase